MDSAVDVVMNFLMKKSNACQSQACAIQNCLQKRGFDATKCEYELAALRKCCTELARRGGTSTACPTANKK
jgi:hypothetical protein